MGKKKTYTLATQEQELGAIIDNSIGAPSNSSLAEGNENASRNNDITLSRNNDKDVVTSESAEAEKKIMKNIWVPAMIDNKLKIIRAYKKQNKLPNTFDAIANEALIEYLERHFEEAMNWG